MNNSSSFNKLIYDAIIKNWDADALTDYQGATLQFHDVARKIEKLHIVFENCDIKKGELLTEENLTVKRPGTGISPMRWEEVVGTKAIKDFSEEDLIEI